MTGSLGTPFAKKAFKNTKFRYIAGFVLWEIFNGLSIAVLLNLLSNYEGTLNARDKLLILYGVSQAAFLCLIHVAFIYYSFHGVSNRMNFVEKFNVNVNSDSKQNLPFHTEHGETNTTDDGIAITLWHNIFDCVVHRLLFSL